MITCNYIEFNLKRGAHASNHGTDDPGHDVILALPAKAVHVQKTTKMTASHNQPREQTKPKHEAKERPAHPNPNP